MAEIQVVDIDSEGGRNLMFRSFFLFSSL